MTWTIIGLASGGILLALAGLMFVRASLDCFLPDDRDDA